MGMVEQLERKKFDTIQLQSRVKACNGNDEEEMAFSYWRCGSRDAISHSAVEVQPGCSMSGDVNELPSQSSPDADLADNNLVADTPAKESLFWVFTNRFAVSLYHMVLGFRPLCS